MKNENALLYGIIGLMAGIILTIIFASNAVNNNMTGAIEMAKLAQERATQTEIKTLAASIIKSQTEEIIQMKNWYKDWYGTEVPEEESESMGMGRGMMRGGMMGDQNDIESLKNAD